MDVLGSLLVVGLLVAAIVAVVVKLARPTQPPKARVHGYPAAYTRDRLAPAPASERLPFAAPGMTGPLFAYGGAPAGAALEGPYAVVDVETTGLSPARGDRVLEVAIARVDSDGRIEDEYATLVNPEGRDVGAIFVHGITDEAAQRAPLFTDIVGEILARLDGAIVVAHNAVFDERFLASELARAGIYLNRMPALCTLWLARQTLHTPNHRLRTLCQAASVADADAHAALGDARAVARLLPRMLSLYGRPLAYPTAAPALPTLPSSGVKPMTRARNLRKGADGWMASLMNRLPESAAETDDAEAEAYLSQLSLAMADGKIIGDEAEALAKLAGSAGMGATQVTALHERFLESMREAAFADDVLTAAELRQLQRSAQLLGVPGYFDDLRPTTGVLSAERVEPAAKARATTGDVAAGKPARQRRCGHCRAPGHYRNTCPDLAPPGPTSAR